MPTYHVQETWILTYYPNGRKEHSLCFFIPVHKVLCLNLLMPSSQFSQVLAKGPLRTTIFCVYFWTLYTLLHFSFREKTSHICSWKTAISSEVPFSFNLSKVPVGYSFIFKKKKKEKLYAKLHIASQFVYICTKVEFKFVQILRTSVKSGKPWSFLLWHKRNKIS